MCARPLQSRARRADSVDVGDNDEQLSSLPGLRLQYATGNPGDTVYYTCVTPGMGNVEYGQPFRRQSAF